MSGHQVRLRWTTHQGTLFGVLQSLLEKNFLVDVTLAAEGQYIRAHKVILCACSPYFEELLSITDDKHPIIMLQDVKYVQLQALISYMYCGEVNIDETNLPALLRIAETLQIRGLFGARSSSTSNKEDTDDDSMDEDDHMEAVVMPPKNSSNPTIEKAPDPPPPKKSKSSNGTNNNNNNNNNTSTRSETENNCERKSPTKESTTTESTCNTSEVSVANSSSSSTTTTTTSQSSTSASKRAKCERTRRTSFSNNSIVEPPGGEKDAEGSNNLRDPHPEGSLDPNQSYLFENYFTNEDSYRDEIIVPSSPPPDDDYKDDDHTQDDSLPLGANADQIFRCFKCGKQYTSNKSLWRHRKFACEGKQTFSCQLCGKSFSRSDNLRRHAVVAHCIQ